MPLVRELRRDLMVSACTLPRVSQYDLQCVFVRRDMITLVKSERSLLNSKKASTRGGSGFGKAGAALMARKLTGGNVKRALASTMSDREGIRGGPTDRSSASEMRETSTVQQSQYFADERTLFPWRVPKFLDRPPSTSDIPKPLSNVCGSSYHKRLLSSVIGGELMEEDTHSPCLFPVSPAGPGTNKAGANFLLAAQTRC